MTPELEEVFARYAELAEVTAEDIAAFVYEANKCVQEKSEAYLAWRRTAVRELARKPEKREAPTGAAVKEWNMTPELEEIFARYNSKPDLKLSDVPLFQAEATGALSEEQWKLRCEQKSRSRAYACGVDFEDWLSARVFDLTCRLPPGWKEGVRQHIAGLMTDDEARWGPPSEQGQNVLFHLLKYVILREEGL